MSIKIKENNEPLVDIRKFCPDVLIAIDKHRMEVEKTAYLRLTVARMLRNARKNLPKGMNFIIRDAWRPGFVQANIYFEFIERFKRRHPSWTLKRIIKEVNEYVAPWKGIGASGHMSGGAIDLRLIDNRGYKIPMVSRKLTYQENALSDQDKLPNYIKRNRKIFFEAMQKAGFSNYFKEFWHWTYGDYYWAKRNHKSSAIYGAVQDVDNLYANKLCSCGSGKKYLECCGK